MEFGQHRRRLLRLLLGYGILLLAGVAKLSLQPLFVSQALGTPGRPIRLLLVPAVDAQKVTESAEALVRFLRQATGYHVEASVPTSYIAVVEAFGAGKADIAAMNAFSYLLARERYGVRAVLRVVRRHGELSYRGQIITHTNTGIRELEQLSGKRIAYVDPASTSGYILPKALLEQAGVRPAEEVFAMRHDNVVTMVYQRQVDAGATYYSPPDPVTGEIRDARARVLKQFPDVVEKVRIIALTDSIPNDPIVVRADLPEPVVERLVRGLLAFQSTPEGRRALFEIYSVEGFAPVRDQDYDGLRQLLRRYVGDVERLLR
ncbi:MAG: phosphate/phosphite/phosphonate ABC transporter substrate-binding protein [Candidatus Kapabacteria bacterium]|nr:phosphate/phosphite/phosphonate ABC transporter substrate-binding protein [Candidatus Kapabacteria bacterium]MDW8012592.1 phosphate/phosphite/phosphonate ABC transporter substrate-binding protein [Bacteroidota bacterium]